MRPWVSAVPLLVLCLAAGCVTTPDPLPDRHPTDEADQHYQRAWQLLLHPESRTDRTQGPTEALTEALSEARRATELAPERDRSWYVLSLLHLRLDQPAEARVAIDRALALAPQREETWRLSGDLHRERGQDAEALADFEKAHALAPDSSLAPAAIGLLHLEREEFPQALASLERAARLDPRDGRTRAGLVRVYQALGQRDRRDAEREALRTLQREGRVREPFYIREQWRDGERRVVVVENLTLEGDWARRYEFQVYAPGQDTPQQVLSLGSYAMVVQLAHERDPAAPRPFHLDGYAPDGTHSTYGLFASEPSYDDVRARVVDILAGRLAPTSVTTPGR